MSDIPADVCTVSVTRYHYMCECDTIFSLHVLPIDLEISTQNTTVDTIMCMLCFSMCIISCRYHCKTCSCYSNKFLVHIFATNSFLLNCCAYLSNN